MSDPLTLVAGLFALPASDAASPPSPQPLPERLASTRSPVDLSDSATVRTSPPESSTPLMARLSQLQLPPLPSASRYLPVTPARSPRATQPSPEANLAPASGPQLYRQRLSALQAGRIYTRVPAHSFWSSWAHATEQPTYEQWKRLLALEARAVAAGQGSNRLSAIVGDSLSLWIPPDRLPQDRLWLNQGISGDTTEGILNRLSALAQTRPDTIYLMAGINDLKLGKSDREILANLHQIVRRLRQDHPQARVIVQSILPTRWDSISNHRIRTLNRQIAAIARREGAGYLDLHAQFSDELGSLDAHLTTDGLHLNPSGYAVWQNALQRVETWIASN